MHYQVEIIGRHKLTIYRAALVSRSALLTNCRMFGFRLASLSKVGGVLRPLEAEGFANTQNRARPEMPNKWFKSFASLSGTC